MEATLTQPRRVEDEGAMHRKLLLSREKVLDLSSFDGTWRISIG